MRFTLTSDLITHFLTHVAITSDTGSADTVLRARALACAQRTVDLYWDQPWKFREDEAAIEFSAQGVAELPARWGWWDRDFGYIVWGDPVLELAAPNAADVRNVMRLRTQYPTRQGPPQAVVMHGGQLKRWPPVPQGGGTEDATVFFHRTGPNLVDAAASTYDAATISADATDNSFNDSAAGFPGLESGDLIGIDGFSGSGASAVANNKQHVVVGTPTASKIRVASVLVTDAAGESVTLTLPVDEWSLIPAEDQMAILDGMLAAYDVKSGDGREPVHERVFRARCARLFQQRNRDQQPKRWGRPFRPQMPRGATWRVRA